MSHINDEPTSPIVGNWDGKPYYARRWHKLENPMVNDGFLYDQILTMCFGELLWINTGAKCKAKL